MRASTGQELSHLKLGEGPLLHGEGTCLKEDERPWMWEPASATVGWGQLHPGFFAEQLEHIVSFSQSIKFTSYPESNIRLVGLNLPEISCAWRHAI